MPDGHSKFLVVGGGAAGITVAARLVRAGAAGQVTIVEPSERHCYQPLWTLVGGGAATRAETERREADLIPPGATWLRDAVESFDPAAGRVKLRSGASHSYDFLVVALGIQLDWQKVKGLQGAIGRAGICSNYDWDTVESTWAAIRAFRGGPALFTHPATPIKCGGAPQKIMYLADDAFRKAGVRAQSSIHFFIGEPVIFKVQKYADALQKVVARKEIQVHYRHDLREVRPESGEAVFADLENNREVVQPFKFLHVTPPQSSPDVLKQSPLGNAAGFVEVDKGTLRHVRFPNVFSLGDCSSLPTSKTGAAVRMQAPVVVANLLAVAGGGQPTATYDGYTSCPLVTGYGRLILAEFDYDLKPRETFPFDQSKERWSMYQLKRRLLPWLYWNRMLRGRA